MEQNQSGSGQQQQRQPPPVYDPTNGGHYGMLPLPFAFNALGQTEFAGSSDALFAKPNVWILAYQLFVR